MAELKITAANFENEVLRSDKPVFRGQTVVSIACPCSVLAKP